MGRKEDDLAHDLVTLYLLFFSLFLFFSLSLFLYFSLTFFLFLSLSLFLSFSLPFSLFCFALLLAHLCCLWGISPFLFSRCALFSHPIVVYSGHRLPSHS